MDPKGISNRRQGISDFPLGESNNNDLLNHQNSSTVSIRVFHDERKCNNWLYHGFVVVEGRDWPMLKEKLLSIRQWSKTEKYIHFKDLTGSIYVSRSTRLAHRWAIGLDNELLPYLRFYLFGVDLSKIDAKLFGRDRSTKKLVDQKIYNRFFEIGIFSALRWFYTDTTNILVTNIYTEQRDLKSNDNFLTNVPFKINLRVSNITCVCDTVEMLLAKQGNPSNNENRALIDCLQMADVFIGSFSQALDYSSKTRKGSLKVSDALFPRIEKLIKNPYNKKSRTYKRIAMCFFPKSCILRDDFFGMEAYSGMYNTRKLSALDRFQFNLFG